MPRAFRVKGRKALRTRGSRHLFSLQQPIDRLLLQGRGHGDGVKDGLCVFAFTSGHTIKCSLHAVALALGLPPAHVKPKVCVLWPLSLSEDDEVLSLADDGYSFTMW